MDELENYFWLNESLKIKKNETVSICNKGIKKKKRFFIHLFYK
jgi:hypothetical protein